MTTAPATLPPPAVPPPMPLALGDYAAVAAHLLHAAGKSPADVLRELGIDAGVWRASAARWERALDDELARATAPTPMSAPAAAPVSAPAPAPRIPDVPNLPIGPDTAIIDGRRVSQPALPFIRAPQPPPPPGDAPPSEPRPSLMIGPTTARFDARCLPPLPESLWSSEANLMEEAAVPLVRVRPRRTLARWARRLRRLLGFGDSRR